MSLWLLPVLTISLTPALTTVWIRHAQQRRLFDTPERRRLHDAPTPRGGGVGPIGAIVAALLAATLLHPAAMHGLALPIVAGLLLVAGVSLIDDHGDVSVRVRLGMHVLAALIVTVAAAANAGGDGRWWIEGGALLVVAMVASMNLHNFMDGSDAHLSAQALFVFAALAALCAFAGSSTLAWLFTAIALAVAAFLPFNWPRARVFLGDVGSISFGFLISALSVVAVADHSIGVGGALILSSGFMIDAGATLLGRMRRTRHWLSPHRDHLYQWLRRCGWAPQRVIAAYQGWNLLVVVPALWLLRDRPAAIVEFALTVVVYALGLVTWIAARRALRRAHRAQ